MQQAVIQDHTAARVANLAMRATLHEAAATGKPGLVCPDTPGAHDDMDFVTLVAGALSLRPYFTDSAALGYRTAARHAESVFPALRELGKTAEGSMYRATGGVNTHKGLLFSLGLFCAAAGRAARLGAPWDAPTLASLASSYTRGLCADDFTPLAQTPAASRLKSLAADPATGRHTLWEQARNELAPLLGRTPTAGEILYVCFGETGIRGEAEAGFPHLTPACKAMRAWLERDSFNDALVNTLLFLMQTMRDTNIMRRGGQQALSRVMAAAKEALDLGGMGAQKGREAVSSLSAFCLSERLSPGGSADMLCLVLFIILGEDEAKAP